MDLLDKALIDDLCAALGVVVLTPMIQEHLLSYDPKAFWQCVAALEKASLRGGVARKIVSMIPRKVYAEAPESPTKEQS